MNGYGKSELVHGRYLGGAAWIARPSVHASGQTHQGVEPIPLRRMGQWEFACFSVRAYRKHGYCLRRIGLNKAVTLHKKDCVMSSRKPFLRSLLLLFGSVGVVACIAVVVGVWSVSGRLTQTAEGLFGGVDQTLVAVGQRVAKTRDRVEASKITSQEIGETLKKRAKRKTGEQLAQRTDIAEKAERLSATLQQADDWLEITQSSIELVQQALAVTRSTGSSTTGGSIETKSKPGGDLQEETRNSGAKHVESVESLLASVGELRSQLKKTTAFVAGIRDLAKGTDGESTRKETVEKAVELASRLVVTLSSIDTHIEQLEDRLDAVRSTVQESAAQTRQWILIVAIVIAFFMMWMAAGQVALCVVGWRM